MPSRQPGIAAKSQIQPCSEPEATPPTKAPMLQPKPIRAPQPISNPPMPAASRDFAGGQADAAKGFVAAAAAMAPNSIPKSVRLDVSVSTESVSRSEEHTSELQSLRHLVCRLLLEKKKSDETTKELHNAQIIIYRQYSRSILMKR